MYHNCKDGLNQSTNGQFSSLYKHISAISTLIFMYHSKPYFINPCQDIQTKTSVTYPPVISDRYILFFLSFS